MSNVVISDELYHRILKAIGYPIISESDLNLTKDNILDLMVKPAMEYFFSYFPKINRQSYEVGLTFDIDFPNTLTFGIVDARMITRAYGGSSKVANPLINDIHIKSVGGGRGRFGTPYNYGYEDLTILKATQAQAYTENQKAVKVKVDLENKKITGYTNITGELSVNWAEYSYNWDHVPFSFRKDLIDLCQAELMEFVGGLQARSSNSLPGELDGANLLETARDIREKITEKFNTYPKVIILRG